MSRKEVRICEDCGTVYRPADDCPLCFRFKDLTEAYIKLYEEVKELKTGKNNLDLNKILKGD